MIDITYKNGTFITVIRPQNVKESDLMTFIERTKRELDNEQKEIKSEQMSLFEERG